MEETAAFEAHKFVTLSPGGNSARKSNQPTNRDCKLSVIPPFLSLGDSPTPSLIPPHLIMCSPRSPCNGKKMIYFLFQGIALSVQIPTFNVTNHRHVYLSYFGFGLLVQCCRFSPSCCCAFCFELAMVGLQHFMINRTCYTHQATTVCFLSGFLFLCLWSRFLCLQMSLQLLLLWVASVGYYLHRKRFIKMNIFG